MPKAANAWVSSQPVGPPPMMPSDFGASVSSNTVSLVSGWAAASPGMSGSEGLEPVASTIRGAVMRLSPTATVSWVTRRARPSITAIPSLRSTSADSVVAMCSTVARTRAMASAKSSPSRAAASTVLDGTQPVKVQSPPGAESVIMATSAPTLRAARTAPSPAAPPPTTIRSWSIIRPRRATCWSVRSARVSCGPRRGRRGIRPPKRPRLLVLRPPACGLRWPIRRPPRRLPRTPRRPGPACSRPRLPAQAGR